MADVGLRDVVEAFKKVLDRWRRSEFFGTPSINPCSISGIAAKDSVNSI
jgi:hypothetical protein